MDNSTDQNYFNPQYPSTEYLRKKAQSRIPGFAFEYLDSGANEEVNLSKNHSDIQKVELMPRYLLDYEGADTTAEIFGTSYQSPFGISPIGLQGLMWPGSPEILAKAAFVHNIPFILSTVSTASIERISEVTEGNFWFQLYHPAQDHLRDDLLKRAWSSGCRVLVALADTPSFGIRYKDVRNGLSMPPKMSLRNMFQICTRPRWAVSTLLHGQPDFMSLKPYMPKGLDLKQLGKFMNETFDGRLSEEKLSILRDKWKGTLVVKGVVNEEDAEAVKKIGADGIIVSNHGGRQIDAGESSIHSMLKLVEKYRNDLTIMMDGGIRSGVDVIRCLASGAHFVFMGRPFMYGVAALGKKGGMHTIRMFENQIGQVMEQLGCRSISNLPEHLIKT